MIDEAPDSEQSNIKRVYDLAASAYESVFFDDLSDAAWLDLLVESLNRGGLVVDVGCGPGNFSAYLSTQGVRTIGIDLSYNMLKIGKSRRNVSIPLIQADMKYLPFADGAFEGELIAYSLLHVRKARAPAVLRELRRVCKDGGSALLLLKEGEDEGLIDASLVPGEVLFAASWTLEQLIPLVRTCGWQVVRVEEGAPVMAEEIQQTKLALFLLAN